MRTASVMQRVIGFLLAFVVAGILAPLEGAPLAVARIDVGVQIGTFSQQASLRFSCNGSARRIDMRELSLDLPDAERFRSLFDVNRFEGPSGASGHLRVTAATDRERVEINLGVTGSFGSVGPAATFTFSSATLPQTRQPFDQMGTLMALLASGPARLTWQLDNLVTGGPPIRAEVGLDATQVASVRSTMERCSAALPGPRPRANTAAASATGRTMAARPGRSAGPIMRSGALDDIPTGLAELGWDTDLPSLLVIRYLPQRMSFAAGWSGWALSYWFHLTRAMAWPQADPWPPFFETAGAGVGAMNTLVLGWPEAQQQQFQEWCIKRSRVVPATIVHAVALVPPSTGEDLVLRPLGLGPDTPMSDQRVGGLGFSLMIQLGLDHDADRDAVTVPARIVATWPRSSLRLESRIHWDAPLRQDGSLFIAGHPVSLRIMRGDDIVWEHAYPEPS